MSVPLPVVTDGNEHGKLAPLASMPAAAFRPGRTQGTPLVRLNTGTGPERLVVERSPSWPKKLFPQHSTPPFTSAQVWSAPAVMASTPLKGGYTWLHEA